MLNQKNARYYALGTYTRNYDSVCEQTRLLYKFQHEHCRKSGHGAEFNAALKCGTEDILLPCLLMALQSI